MLNQLIPFPTFNSPEERLEFELLTGKSAEADLTFFELTMAYPDNIDYHYQYIQHYFYNVNKGEQSADNLLAEQHIYERYTYLSESYDSTTSDIGHYGKGLIYMYKNDNESAIYEFLKVQNKHLKYLNNSIGNILWNQNELENAISYYHKEIDNNGNVEGAYYNLSRLLYYMGDWDTLTALLQNPDAEKYASPPIKKIIYFENFQPLKYAKATFGHIFERFNIWGALAALLITGSWIMYLRKVDVFEPEKWIHIIITFCLGMVFSFIVEPLTDINVFFFNFNLNGGFIHDFFYCVIGIGVVEELAKIIPFLLVLKYTKAINEPYDYILYASISALGFAFVENLIYFEKDSLQIIHGRALTAVILHMFLSSIIAYGIMLNKYKRRKNPFVNFVIFFLIAAIAHGFYDFWLINETASQFSMISMIFLVFSFTLWNTFKNNALNHSEFFDKNKAGNLNKLEDYLVYSLVGIFLFEYIAMAINYSTEVANERFYSSAVSGAFLVFFISTYLGKFRVYKGYWHPLIRRKKDLINLNFDAVAGKVIELKRFTSNNATTKFLPNKGIVSLRISVSNEPDWYVIELDSPVLDTKCIPNQVLIRTKDKKKYLEGKKFKFIAFYLIPKDLDLEHGNLQRKDLIFCGWAKAKVIE